MKGWLRSTLLGMILLGGLAAGCGGAMSTGEPTPEPEINPTAEAIPTPAPTPVPAIPEQRMLTLEWPATLRQGDSDLIRLTLEIDDQGRITPTAQIGGHSTSGEIVEIPNLYETHHVFAEARLDLAGAEIAPPGTVSQSLLPGRTVNFTWSVRLSEASTYRGSVWFYLSFIPKEGGEETQIAISSMPLEIRVTNLFGLSGQPARWLGLTGSVVGSALGIDTVFGWAWKLLKKKKPKPVLKV